MAHGDPTNPASLYRTYSGSMDAFSPFPFAFPLSP